MPPSASSLDATHSHRTLACPTPAAFAPRVIRRLALAFTLGAAPWLSGAVAPKIEADDVQAVENARGFPEVTAKGNARASGDGLLLLADELRYNGETTTLTALGRVTFTRGEARLLADRLEYTQRDGSFRAENIRLGSYPYFAEGASAFGTASEITVRQARVSYGEPGRWQPTLTAETVVIAPGQRVRTEDASAGIGRIQFFPFPKFQHDFDQPLAGAVSLQGGFRRSLGLFADVGLLVPVSQHARLGADLGLYSERGVMIGPAAAYSSPDNPERLRGRLHSGYINDHGDKKTDLLGRPVPEERAYLEWQHQQYIAPGLSLNAQVNWWKDSEVVRDFRPRAFFPVQEPDTFIESVYTGTNFFLSAFTRLQPNRFHRVQERLPEVRFDLLPVSLGHGFVHRFSASAAVLREDPVVTGRKLRSNRFDAYYALMRPIAHRDWLTFTPVAGARITHYANTEGAAEAGDYTRSLGELGADLVVRTSGTFDYKNPQWKIDGLRHLFTPRLSYRYLPHADRGRGRIPQIDRTAFSTYLPPLGLGDVRNIDDLHPTHTLRVSLDNVLQTRDPAQGSRDLVFLSLANDFRFRRRPGERDVSETHVELALLPARWLQVDLYQSFAPQTFTLRELNAGVTLRDGTLWSVRFGNNFLRRQLEDYLVDGRVRLNERFEAVTRLHYDARRNRFNEQSYGLAQNLGNTWLVSYTVSLYSGRRRESSFGFNVRVDSLSF